MELSWEEGGAERWRVFFAVDLDPAARRAAAELAARLRRAPAGDAVRWVPAENYHLTLRFLGSVERARIAPLTESVRETIGGRVGFELRLGSVRAFPSARQPRVVALGVEPVEPLAALAAAVEQGVVAAGFAPERRRFRAHLTLGRVRASRLPPLDAKAQPVRFMVSEVVLYRSRLEPSGATYTALERLALGRLDSPQSQCGGD